MAKFMSVLNPFQGALGYLRIFRRHLGQRIYIIFALALLAALTEGLGITLLLPLIDALDVGAGAGEGTPLAISTVLKFIGIEGSAAGLLMLVWGAFLLKGLITFAYQSYAGRQQARLQHHLQQLLYRRFTAVDYAHYVTRSTGHFVNLINTQVSAFYQSFSSFQQFLVNCIKALTYLGIALALAWRFGLMAIAAGVLLMSAFRHLNNLVKRLSKLTVAELTTLNKLLVQAVQAFKYLTSTDTMRGLADPIEASLGRVRLYRRRQLAWQAFTASLTEPLSVSLILTIILIQVALLEQPLAPILVSILLFHRGMTAMMTLQAQWQQTMGTIGAVDILEHEFDELDANRERRGGEPAPALIQGIELDAISYRYAASSQPVLKALTLHIPALTTVALVGRSGAGKSTLVDILTLMLRPQSGRVLIDGVEAEQIDVGSWRRQIGYVSQETVVFDDTIAANIALQPVQRCGDSDILDQIWKAAGEAHLSDVIRQLPEGLWTRVGDRGIRLSGGQRQRLFIARELYRKPRLLILDEATSALDGESEAAVQESIDALRGHVTLVVIAHRLSTVRGADRIYVLSEGRVVEQGSYAELRDLEDGRFAAMVELQSL